MTVNSVVNSSRQEGNAATVDFSANIKIFNETDIGVQLLNRTTSVVETTLILNDGGADGFTVVFDTDDENLTITVNTAPTALQDILIYRSVPLTQGLDLPYGNRLPSVAIETALDKVVVTLQDTDDSNNRALRSPVSDTAVSGELPSIVGNAGGVIVPNSSENGFEYRTLLATDTIVNFNKDVFSGTGAQTEFTLSQSASVQNALEVFVAGARQEPAVDFSVSGSTLIFTVAPTNGTDNIYVIDAATSTVSGVPTDGSVTNTKLSSMAGDTIKGRVSTTGTPQDLTPTQIRTIADVYSTLEVDAAVATKTGITLETPQATTSGTEVDFVIPSGVKKFTVNIQNLSTSGTSLPLLRLIDADGVEATGYVGTGGRTTSAGSDVALNTTGFLINDGDAVKILNGSITFNLLNEDTFLWTCGGDLSRTGATAGTITLSGTKALSKELSGVRITTANGTDTLTLGLTNISYE